MVGLCLYCTEWGNGYGGIVCSEENGGYMTVVSYCSDGIVVR